MSEPGPDADPAHERLAAILRKAMPLPDETALEDETRRIMLHLSVEPVPPLPRAAEQSRQSAEPVKN